MDPYEARSDKIPPTDRYADVPLYGRYHPQPDDFRPDPKHVGEAVNAAPQDYWASVLGKCDASARIYEDVEGGRDVFALGAIVKSGHLHPDSDGRRAGRDHAFGDANEVEATQLARRCLPSSVKVPEIYFAGKIDGKAVLVQARLPGVGLNVAWQYLSRPAKESFKEQARGILKRLASVQPPEGRATRGYVVPDSDPVKHRGIQDIEHRILFLDHSSGSELGFMHNDTSLSNLIVSDGKIVGLIDWEMAGFFGWTTAGEVHDQIRTPKRESYAHLNLPQDLLEDILFWKELYTVENEQATPRDA